MEILTAPHPMLSTPCRPDWSITSEQIRAMFRLMAEHKGYGLAAPQVGIDARLFITDWGQVFCNPVIVAHSDETSRSREGCLSLPGVTRWRSRYVWVELSSGERFHDLRAIVIQHEVDHLHGLLITDTL